jgi:Na+/proline symporter
VGLFLKNIGGNQVFIGGVIAQTIIFICHYLNSQEVISIGFLWYNVIATFIVITISILLNTLTNKGK